MIDPISWEYSLPYILAAFFGGYLLGSVPFGLLLTRIAGLGDIRNVGSGNIGATNVLRTGRKTLAALTLLLDAGKGIAAVLVASLYGPDIMIVAALGALLGHLFPVWLKFNGGKGVATALGLILALSWPVAVIALAIWIAVAAITRYSSLAALIASGSTPFVGWYFASPQIAEFFVVLAILIWFRHIPNIRRLISGTESRIGGSKS